MLHTRTQVIACADFAHDEVCPTTFKHDRIGCVTGPLDFKVSVALDLLDEKPNDANRVRVMLHDYVCHSGCTGDQAKDHAKTQTQIVTEIRRWHKANR